MTLIFDFEQTRQTTTTMIIPILNPVNGLKEWCLLEFQGDMIGIADGESLGNLTLTNEVS